MPHILGDKASAGICGSGVVDALACLLELGFLDESGLLEEDPSPIAPPVVLTQRDVRMAQLAKSAVCAGLCTLAHRAGLDWDDVEELVVAGGFGRYLRVEAAGRIGLLPGELVPRVRGVGNGVLSGAAMLLLNQELWGPSEALAADADTLELSTDSFFGETYVEGMLFPEE